MIPIPNIADAGVARTARKAGLGEQYRFFRGASRRRYLFSEVNAAALGFYRHAVLILAVAGEDGDLSVRAVFAIGEEGLSARDQALLPRGRLFIRLPADDAERKRLLRDLSVPTRTIALAA